MFLKTLIFLFLVSCDTKSSRLKEKPVLIVNGQQLTLKQFSEKLSAVLAPYDALSVKSMDVLKLAKLRVENDFIHNSILINYSVKNNVRISEEDVEEKLTQLRASYPNDIAFRKALAEQRVSFDQWRESIKASMLATKVVKAITLSEYVPSEKDVLEYFKNNPQEFKAAAQIRLRQIVVNQETEAKKILSTLKSGAVSLAELAKKFSIAPEASKGGDTGFVEKGTLELFDSAFALKVGQRSEIVKSPFGYHIYEILEKKEAKNLSIDQARTKIKRRLLEDDEQQVFDEWYQKEIKLLKIFKDTALIDALKVTTEIK